MKADGLKAFVCHLPKSNTNTRCSTPLYCFHFCVPNLDLSAATSHPARLRLPHNSTSFLIQREARVPRVLGFSITRDSLLVLAILVIFLFPASSPSIIFLNHMTHLSSYNQLAIFTQILVYLTLFTQKCPSPRTTGRATACLPCSQRPRPTSSHHPRQSPAATRQQTFRSPTGQSMAATMPSSLGNGCPRRRTSASIRCSTGDRTTSTSRPSLLQLRCTASLSLATAQVNRRCLRTTPRLPTPRPSARGHPACTRANRPPHTKPSRASIPTLPWSLTTRAH